MPIEDWKDTMFRSFPAEFAEILKHKNIDIEFSNIFDTIGNQRFCVLDLGCGTGRLLESLSKHASVVVGLDYSPELLSIAAEIACRLPNVVLVQGDARKLVETFPAGHFNAIVRAYTSLGYFPRTIEVEMLRQCAVISHPSALLLIDSFNKDWFRLQGERVRETPISSFTLKEHYHWNELRNGIDCCWQYLRHIGAPIEIPFFLEGYAVRDVQSVLLDAGWRVRTFLSDLASATTTDNPGQYERIVAVAEKAS